jgi:hypothetical protein
VEVAIGQIVGFPEAGVRVTPVYAGRNVATGLSDAQGRYGVLLPANNYQIRAECPPNFIPAQVGLTVGKDPSTRDIPLQRVKID